MDILEFQGDYRWLSNFWPATVHLDGDSYPSVENAYQAAKFEPGRRAQFVNCTPGQAKRLGRSLFIRDDWEQIKVQVMRSLIQQKFEPGSDLGNKLAATGHSKIVEGNTWGDTFWGVCRGRGRNVLGELLMAQRAVLLSERGD